MRHDIKQSFIHFQIQYQQQKMQHIDMSDRIITKS